MLLTMWHTQLCQLLLQTVAKTSQATPAMSAVRQPPTAVTRHSPATPAMSDVRQPPTAVTRHSPAGSETLRRTCSAGLAPTCGVSTLRRTCSDLRGLDAPPDSLRLLRPAGSETLRRTRSACSAAKEPHLTTRSAPTPLKTSGVPIPALTPSGVSPCSAGQ